MHLSNLTLISQWLWFVFLVKNALFQSSRPAFGVGFLVPDSSSTILPPSPFHQPHFAVERLQLGWTVSTFSILYTTYSRGDNCLSYQLLNVGYKAFLEFTSPVFCFLLIFFPRNSTLTLILQTSWSVFPFFVPLLIDSVFYKPNIFVDLSHLDLPELLLSNDYVLPRGSAKLWKLHTINEDPVESIPSSNSPVNIAPSDPKKWALNTT